MNFRTAFAAGIFAATSVLANSAGAQGLPAPGPVIVAAPAAARQGPTATSTPVVQSGILQLKVTITIVSAIPTTTPILCQFSPSVSGQNSTTSEMDWYQETGSVLATRTGNTATCTVRIPYTWTLHAASADMVTPAFTVTATDTTGVGRTSGTYGFAMGLATNGAFPLPANGATTALTRAIRL